MNIINGIKKQIDDQNSFMAAFPSQALSFESSFTGQNQRATVQLQLESTKMLAEQQRQLSHMNQTLGSLIEYVKQSQALEDIRYKENLRFTKIAAWSGVAATVLTLVIFGIQLALR